MSDRREVASVIGASGQVVAVDDGSEYKWAIGSTAEADGINVLGSTRYGRWLLLEKQPAQAHNPPNVVNLWEQPGFHPGNLNKDSSPGWRALFSDTDKVKPGTRVMVGPYEYSFWSPIALDTASRAGLYGFRIIGENAANGDSPITSSVFHGNGFNDPNRAFLTWGVTQSSLERVAITLDNGEARCLIRAGRISPTVLGTRLSRYRGGYDGEVVRVSGWHRPGDEGSGHARWNASSTAAEDGLNVWGVAPIGRWLRTSTGALLHDMPKSWNRFDSVNFTSNGKVEWSFEFDDLLGGSNLENFTLQDCRFDIAGCEQGAVRFSYFCQPYTTIFRGCSFMGGNNAVPHGTGIGVENFSCQAMMYGCDFQQLETSIRMQRAANVSVYGGQFELCQRVASLESISGVGANVSIYGARINLCSELGSDGPIVRAAGSDVYTSITSMGTVTYTQCNIGGLGVGEEYKVEVGGYGKVVWRDCSLPGAEVARFSTTNPPLTGCGIWTEACVARSPTVEGAISPIPPYRGRLNPDGYITIAGATATRTIAFSQPEPDADYQLDLSFRSASGGASAASTIARVTGQTADGFTVMCDAAPGAGESVTFGYRVVPAMTVFATAESVDGLVHRWDPALGVTGTSPVTGWVDQAAGESLIHESGVPALTANNANVNGLPTIDLPPGATLASDQPASFWGFLTGLNGDDGYTIIEVIYVPAGGDGASFHLGTKRGYSTGKGMGVDVDQARSSTIATFADGSSSLNWWNTGWSDGLSYWTLRVRSRGGNDSTVSLSNSGNESTPSMVADLTPIPGDPAFTFGISGNLSDHTISVGEVLVYNRALPTHELRGLIEGYIRPKYGDL